MLECLVLAAAISTADSGQSAPAVQTAAVCFGTGERVDGLNKICYYDCLSGTVAITIRSTQLCPLTIND